MLWVRKRTISMRWFFWAPKTYAYSYGLEDIYNFTLKICAYLNLCLTVANKNHLHMQNYIQTANSFTSNVSSCEWQQG